MAITLPAEEILPTQYVVPMAQAQPSGVAGHRGPAVHAPEASEAIIHRFGLFPRQQRRPSR
ncbi:MAG: hypothetical protein EBS48_04765 [Actinobacteria bacterium]|nr:hypothetical protein [Actinomycetota bacterium]